MSSANTDVFEGGCRCGAVRYRATGKPRATSLCHCRSCRLSAGAPMVAWAIFNETELAIVSGSLSTHQSSPGVQRGFCGNCGTSLTYRRADRPGLFDVTTASLDDPDSLPPAKEIWISERLSWVASDETRPQFEQFSTSASPS